MEGKILYDLTPNFADASDFQLHGARAEGGEIELISGAATAAEAEAKARAWLLLYPRGSVYVMRLFAYAQRVRDGVLRVR